MLQFANTLTSFAPAFQPSAEALNGAGIVWSQRSTYTNLGDDVHLIYPHEEGNQNFKLRYMKRTYGSGWGGSTTLYAQWPPSTALIARGTDLYAFYNKATAPGGANPADVSSAIVAYRKWNGSIWEDEVIVVTEANNLVIRSMTSSPKRGVEWQLKTSNYLRYLG